jgi:hypothetical protein
MFQEQLAVDQSSRQRKRQVRTGRLERRNGWDEDDDGDTYSIDLEEKLTTLGLNFSHLDRVKESY